VTPRLNEPWRLPGLEISVAAAPLNADWLWPRVVLAPPDVAAHIQAGGLQLANIRDADSGLFAEAAEAIAWVPSVAAIVATRVAAVHLLQAEPGYDVSHSEPRWGDRIFVSVPDRGDEFGALRLAEGIIHETLHLHLTELESITPLVRDQTGSLASPWRPEPRSFGGVLHGAFVFVGLKAYFDAVTALSGSVAGRHLDQRRTEIAEELSQVNLAALTAGLTEPGAALLSQLFVDAAEVVAEA
jgi:HEXXH motif-containing protein